ncbi:MAG: hypothetical protein LAP87_22995 [Acidobacteriia bacterium]|nr:hypothetical protein [Terriglobia bacterium]
MTPLSIRPLLIFLAASGIVFAQSQPPSSPPQQPAGGWRRAGDPPPAPQAQLPTPPAEAQDPAEPVDRQDAYGQPQRPPEMNPQAAPRNDRPAYGLPAQVTLKPGTFVTVRIDNALSSDHNQPGDLFTGTLVQPVVADGVVLAQRGQTVYGRVAEAQKAHGGKDSRLGLELTGLTVADGTQEPLRSQLVGRQGPTTPKGEQVATVAGTTAVGAAVGAAADWGRGAAIGAGAGAAAGIIGVLLTRNHPTIVYPETVLTFRIESPVTVSTARAPQAFRYVGPEDYERSRETQIVRRGPSPYGYYYGPGYYPYYPYYYPYWGSGVGFFFGPRVFIGRGFHRFR